MPKKILAASFVIIWLLFAATPNLATTSAASAAEYVKRYQENYPAHLKSDKVMADAFLAAYNQSEAQALVARAVWYMENGYMIYGHSKYPATGFIDCSNFVSLVYKDFGYTIPTASKKYNQIGTKVEGVYSRKQENSNKYELVGIDKLKPGDIFTFWVKDGDGSETHIGHAALYMGKINGQPAIIQTKSDRPTAIGITTSFKYWYGEHFAEARRVLIDDAQLPAKAWQAAAPVIPAIYQLQPQKAVAMPPDKFLRSQLSEPATVTPFADITGHWAEESILRLLLSKSIKGYPDGTFRANATITRAEFITALVNAFQLKPQSGKVFTDTASHWAQHAIATAASYGIIAGYNDKNFGPDDPVTREQMAVMIVAAADLDIETKGNLAGLFKDSARISDWSAQAVMEAKQADIISGYPDKTFRPTAWASRAEGVTVITKALDKTS